MPIIHVNMVTGRSDEQKDRLAREISRIVSEIADVRIEAVRVLIHEIEPAHWYNGVTPKGPPS